jgi:hypothetical protein
MKLARWAARRSRNLDRHALNNGVYGLNATTVVSPLCKSFTVTSQFGCRLLRIPPPRSRSTSCRDTSAACLDKDFEPSAERVHRHG